MTFKIVEDDFLKTINYFFIFLFFFGENKVDILSESSGEKMMHMKCQVLLSWENKKKNISECCLLVM